jgi:hypothetical protein
LYAAEFGRRSEERELDGSHKQNFYKKVSDAGHIKNTFLTFSYVYLPLIFCSVPFIHWAILGLCGVYQADGKHVNLALKVV